MRVLNRENILDIISGATLLGSGGGGSPKDGLSLVEKIFSVATGVELASPDEVCDSDYIAMIAGIGSPKALRERGFDVEALYAYDALERVYWSVGVKFSYVMPGEIGGFNTITPMYVSACKKVPVVDCDGNGRAVPELATTLYAVYGIPTSPIVLADKNGNIVIGYPRDPLDISAGESIARGFAIAAGMIAAFGTWVVNGRTMRECLVLNSISKCENIGKAIREAIKAGRDPVREAAAAINGYELIRGKITDISTKTVGGFDFGRTTIEGVGPYAGKKLIIDFKNENMIAWSGDGEPLVIVPDLICLMSVGGEPLTNADTQVGMEIAVIAAPAPKKWKASPKGFEVWRHILEKMGYTGPHKPIKTMV
ncbi:MAG: DUF917 domain-containing protein [Candidatus Bathyarchaeia archaeon]|nr:DUF917 domain-containing protein [Candidatus Bathyarchaeota archaeon]